MPQIFQVLRCYKCSVFQVHQTRKDNKWVCKLCGEKQSVKRHYGIGTAKDCRLHVQKLNCMRGEKEETIKTYISDNSDCDETTLNDNKNNEVNNEVNIDVNKTSKWNSYIDEAQNLDTNEPQYLNNVEVVLEVPTKRKSSMSHRKQIKCVKKSVANIICNSNSNSDNEVEGAIEAKMTCNINPMKSCPQEAYLATTTNSNTQNLLKILNPQDNAPSISRPSIMKSSKWCQYLEKDSANTPSVESVENCPRRDFLFSLSNDNDIDEILDL